VALYGRWRIGKTALLTHWLGRQPVPAAMWTAQRSTSKWLLESASRAFCDIVGSSGAVFESWERLFEALGRAATQRRLIVVIDEFTHLLESVPEISSILQAAWDRHLKQTKIVLVVSGSHYHMMHEEFIRGRRPLFGRTMADILLSELAPNELQTFLPRYSASQLVETYAVIGGVPKYLEMWNGSRSVEYNLQNVVLAPITIFRQEPMALIQDEISEPRTYLAILQALGAKRLGPKAIGEQAGIALPHVGKYLHRLETLRFVRKIASLATGDPLSTRLVRYEISDAYLRFYFQFIAPRIQLFEQHRTESLLRPIRKGFDSFVATTAFEELCRRHLAIMGERSQLPFDPEWVGQAWNRSTQIDVVALEKSTRNVLVGECKWHTRPMSAQVYTELQAKVKKSRYLSDYNVHYALFSKAGFTKALRESARKEDVHLIGLAELGLHRKRK
jgi:AAA+ ATPase superfamily predicted ATPase